MMSVSHLLADSGLRENKQHCHGHYKVGPLTAGFIPNLSNNVILNLDRTRYNSLHELEPLNFPQH